MNSKTISATTVGLLVLMLIGLENRNAFAAHPQVLVTPSDRAALQNKVKNVDWANTGYEALKKNVDKYVELTQTDPQFMTSRLLMNWQTHYTQPFVEKQRWIRGEGRAPVATPRFAGARDWVTDYRTPQNIEDWKPFNEKNDQIWLLNGKTNQSEWVNPGITGRTIEVGNARILSIAANASFVYWITGEEKYAKFASDILSTYLDGFQYIQLPRDVDPTKEYPARIVGFTSFEVIHEASGPWMGLSYDFLHDYLVKQGKDVGMMQAQLKRFSDRIIDGGNAVGNWNLNQINNFIYPILALEDDAAYPDKKGRQYYIDVILNARLPNQTGISHVIKDYYDTKTALWPEAAGYAFGTTPQLLRYALLLRNQPTAKALLEDPILVRAMLAQAQLTYPNGWSNGVGDTNNTRVRTDGLELAIAAERALGHTATELRLTAVLDREIASGAYSRGAKTDLDDLVQYVDTLKPAPAIGDALSRSFGATPLNTFMLRNEAAAPEHGLAASLFGTQGGHIHANGMAIELYGAGLVLGADPGRGSSYWQQDHGQYYLQPPAHNTVIVNGKSNYPVKEGPIAVQVTAQEPASERTALSPNLSFIEGAFAYKNVPSQQQRTLALVRVSPRSGFYFDVFRSKAETEAGSFHDYLYHNIGQGLSLTTQAGAALRLAASDLLTSKAGNMVGYDYFQAEKSVETAQGIHGVFLTKMADGSQRNMGLWMIGAEGRRVFSVEAPKDNAGREALAKDVQALPMPTLVVRQSGDAWKRPFVTVFEPFLGADGAAIKNVRAAKVEGAASGLAASVVEGKAPDQVDSFSVVLAQSDQPTQSYMLESQRFQGRFGAIVKQGTQVQELYLGNGQTLGDSTLFVTGSQPLSASLLREKGGWRYASSGTATVGMLFPAVTASAAGSWKIAIIDKTGARTTVPAQIRLVALPSGAKAWAATSVLPAGEEFHLTLVKG